MRRLLPAVVLVALVVAVAFVWLSSEPADNIPARPDDRPVAVTVQKSPTELGAPKVESPGRSDAAPVTVPAPDSKATQTSTWTGVRVHVTAVEDGHPLPGTSVRARELAPGTDTLRMWTVVEASHGKVGESPRTDASGIAELELAAGETYAIDASNDPPSASSESVSLDRPIASNEVREIDIALRTRPDLVLHGRVIDRETQAPIVGARIEALGRVGDAGSPTTSHTDTDGRFHAVGATWKSSVHSVSADGYPVVWVTAVVGHATPEAALEVALSRSATLRVRFVDASGAPIPGAIAVVSTAKYRLAFPGGSSAFGWISGDETWLGETDADGSARLEGLPARTPLDGHAGRDKQTVWRSAAPILLEPGEVRDVEWRIGSAPALRGIVVELDGTPIPNFDLSLEAAWHARPTHFTSYGGDVRRSTRSDAAGRFVFTDLGPGNWWVGPTPRGRAQKGVVARGEPAPFAQLVSIVEGEAPSEVEIRVQRGLSIAGKVLDPSGGPVDFAGITLHAVASGAIIHESSNDSSGQFVIGPLKDGEYEITASAMGNYVDSPTVRARTGDTGVELRLRTGGTIRGVVVDRATGQPSEARLICASRNAPELGWRMISAKDDGSFEFGGLASGNYDLSASASNGRVGILAGIAIVAGSTHEGARVELEPGARVRVRYDGPWANVGFCVLANGVVVAADGLEKGTEHEYFAPVGEVLVRVTDSGEGREYDTQIELAAGKVRSLEFDGAWK